jgi:hypothetical protein
VKALALGLVLLALVEWATRRNWGGRITEHYAADGTFTGMRLDYPDCAIEWPYRDGRFV